MVTPEMGRARHSVRADGGQGTGRPTYGIGFHAKRIPEWDGGFMVRTDAQVGPHGDHEPARGAGFDPQGRPLADARSCGLKSALLGRFIHGEVVDGANRLYFGLRHRLLPAR